MDEQFPFPACRVEQVSRAGPERVNLALRATRPQAVCPTCLTLSNAVHSGYGRHRADLPSLGHAVCLKLSVRRFYCRNQACRRQTFDSSTGMPLEYTPGRSSERLTMANPVMVTPSPMVM